MTDLPNKTDLIDWIRANPDTGKREIAKAFGIKGNARVDLKEMLRDLQDQDEIVIRNRKIRQAGQLPAVAMLRIIGPDADGDLFAEPSTWDEEEPAPRIMVVLRKSDPAIGRGAKVLCKLKPVFDEDHSYQARLIARVAETPSRVIGIFHQGSRGGRITPVDKRSGREWSIAQELTRGAEDGELVEAEILPTTKRSLPKAQIVERHGDPMAPKQVSLIAMVRHRIELGFPEDAVQDAEAARPVGLGKRRQDLRSLPLITIDPADARDHDDAICAMPDDDPANPGGHVVWVAIADVAHYVRPGTPLDAAARTRGNSTYFPDRVAPMLPDALSADLCSLHEGVDRPCMAVRMVLAADGEKRNHQFVRGLMRSAASLSYEEVQTAIDGGESSIGLQVTAEILRPLYASYKAAAKARDRRQPLDLDLPERRVELSEDGAVDRIYFKDRLDAHRLVEEFMILANVAAAETLETAKSPVIYRVHEEPSKERLENLRRSLEDMDIKLAKGQVLMTKHLNKMLRAAHGTDDADVVAMSVLRAQMQAYYAPQNLGHFGLHLPRYAHFTSPIRRYADLLVHRALISALDLGPGGLPSTAAAALPDIAEHISKTERVSMEAERDTIDRYVAAFLSDRVGGRFTGRISGVSGAGLFVRLEETGADGLVPISTLGSDYFVHDRERKILVGERSGKVFHAGMSVEARLVEASPVTGGLILKILSAEGARISAPRTRKTGGARRGKISGKRRANAAKRRRKRA
ncbi:MAG: ribonuclease R [Pseudomonadota bacterium]